MLQIPQQLSDALTGVDASFSRAVQQLGLNNDSTAKTILVPGIAAGVGTPIDNLHAAVTTQFGEDHANAIVENMVQLHDYRLGLHIESGVAALNNLVKGLAGNTASPASIGDQQALFVSDAIAGDVGNMVQDALGALASLVKSTTGFWGPLVRSLATLSYTGEMIAVELEQTLRLVEHAGNRQVPTQVLGTADAIEAFRRGIISDADLTHELTSAGLDITRVSVLNQLAQFMFGPSDIVNLLARGIITDADAVVLLGQNKMTPGQYEAFSEGMDSLLSPADANTALARGLIDQATYTNMLKAARVPQELQAVIDGLRNSVLNPSSLVVSDVMFKKARDGFLSTTLNAPLPAEVYDAYAKAQLPPEQAAMDWMNHWRVPGVDWWVQAYYRGLRTKTECYAAFEFLSVPQETWEDQFTVRGELISAFILIEIIKAGVLTEDEGRAIMQQQGMIPNNIDIMLKYAKSAGKTSKAATAGDLQKVSLATAAALYDDKALTHAQYVQVLQDHGYSVDAANLTIELADIKAAQAERTAYATLLAEQVKLGILARDDALSQLFSAGFTDAETAKYAAQIDSAKTLNVKLPTESQLNSMLKKGIITADVWSQTMAQLGYSATWMAALQQLV